MLPTENQDLVYARQVYRSWSSVRHSEQNQLTSQKVARPTDSLSEIATRASQPVLWQHERLNRMSLARLKSATYTEHTNGKEYTKILKQIAQLNKFRQPSGSLPVIEKIHDGCPHLFWRTFVTFAYRVLHQYAGSCVLYPFFFLQLC